MTVEQTAPSLQADSRPHRRLFAIVTCVSAVLLSLVVGEILLRVADFPNLRLYAEEHRLPHDHDPELGWYHILNKVNDGVRINSIGLRDIELAPTDKPTILFVGDSFVWGWDVDDDERFTDILREDLPGFRVVNAGVVGYGTDQEYLLLQRLWAKIQPAIVVLIVCVSNDHVDNSTNSREIHTLKPYFANVGGKWGFQGQPVPRPHNWYYYNSWFANQFALVRLGITAYKFVRYPVVIVPDPTSQLVGMMRDFVEARGARFLVGLEREDPILEPYLAALNIPYTRFDGAQILPNDFHWSAEGHALVAERLKVHFAGPNAPAPDER